MGTVIVWRTQGGHKGKIIVWGTITVMHKGSIIITLIGQRGDTITL